MSPRYPAPGDTLHLVRATTPVRIDAEIGQGGQGIVYRGAMGNGLAVAVKWIKPGPFADSQWRAISELTGHPRPHGAFAWPIDMVRSENAAGFGYVMPWIPTERFMTLIELLDAPVQPSFRVLAGLGRELADAFAKLHGAGLCYRDINFGNLLVDPERVEVAIIDNDNVGTTDGEVFIRGTYRFMAPEVIRGSAPPSVESDLYSLAVFLFYLLVHGHPLEGRRVQECYTWWSEQHVSESEIAERFFGEEPLFVFDPHDEANRPPGDDPMGTWWSIYPSFLRELFLRSFGPGLSDPTVGIRVSESEWRRALVRLGDSESLCSCNAAVLWDPDAPAAPCWSCGAVPPLPALLSLRGYEIVLAPGAAVTKGHVSREADFRTQVATVLPHPRQPGGLVIKNLSDSPWTVEPEGEGVKTVNPAQMLGVRPMSLRIGSTDGTIRVGQGGSPQ